MNEQEKDQYNARARVVKAMGHPSRLYMIDQLQKGPLCVCELTEMVGADTSTVSKHLSVLKNAGLVYDQRDGNTVYYHLRVPCVLDFLNCVDSVLEVNMDEQIRIVRSCQAKNIS